LGKGKNSSSNRKGLEENPHEKGSTLGGRKCHQREKARAFTIKRGGIITFSRGGGISDEKAKKWEKEAILYLGNLLGKTFLKRVWGGGNHFIY